MIPRQGFLRAAGGENLPGAVSVAPVESAVERERFRSSWAMTAWRSLAGAETVGQGRKPRSGGAFRDSLDGLALVRPPRPKRSRSHLGKIWGGWRSDRWNAWGLEQNGWQGRFCGGSKTQISPTTCARPTAALLPCRPHRAPNVCSTLRYFPPPKPCFAR